MLLKYDAWNWLNFSQNEEKWYSDNFQELSEGAQHQITTQLMPGGGTQYKSGYRDVPQTWVAKSGCQVHQWVPFFRKCGTWMGVPSMGHFLSLIEVHRWAIFYHWGTSMGHFFIIGTSMGRKFSITGTAIVDISFSLSSSRLRKLYKMRCRWQIITVSWTKCCVTLLLAFKASQLCRLM